MASESTSPADLSAIPNSVSGDGTTFVRGLKQYLEKYDSNVDKKISNIGEGTVNQITNLNLQVEHRTNSEGYINDIKVMFRNDDVADYSFAQIWFKKSAETAWVQSGTTQNLVYVIQDVAIGTYDVKVVACNNSAGYSDFKSAPEASIKVTAPGYICNQPSVLRWDNSDGKWHWEGYVDNGWTDFFELRVDDQAGVWNINRLAAIPKNQFWCDVAPPSRQGTGYLFVRNRLGQYNLPITCDYTVTAPRKPNKPTVEATLDGVVISMDALPSGCIGYTVGIAEAKTNTNGDALQNADKSYQLKTEYEFFNIETPQWTYFKFTGNVVVKYCFNDNVGYGPYSDEVCCKIDKILEDFKIPTVTLEKLSDTVKSTLALADTIPDIEDEIDDLDSDIKEVISVLGGYDSTSGTKTFSAIKQTKDSISNVVAELNKTDGTSQYSAITQLSDAIELKVDKTDGASMVTAINLDKSKVYITGDKVAIDANHVNISGAIISGGNIKTGEIATSHMKANSIDGDRITAGTLDAKKIKAETVTVGTWPKYTSGDHKGQDIPYAELTTAQKAALNVVSIKNGTINGKCIEANSITADEISANAVNASAFYGSSMFIAGDNGEVTISPDYLKVGGSKGVVTISDGAISANMLSADAINATTVTVSKMNNAINGGAATGARITITSNLISVYDSNGTLRVRLGVW